jgi:hypothetical protein
MGAWFAGMMGQDAASVGSKIASGFGIDAVPGATDEELAEWEKSCGVSLPEVLRQVLKRQHGGFVRETSIRLLPLDLMDRPSAGFWKGMAYQRDEVPNRRLVFKLAEDEYGGAYYLNYTGRDARQEPSVMLLQNNPDILSRVAESVTDFLERLLATNDSPSVDWSETNGLNVLARETIDLSASHNNEPAALEQVLASQDGSLVLFTHERTPAVERYARIALPQPLASETALIVESRPAPCVTYSLTLEPEDATGTEASESRRTIDGRWKDTSRHGLETYATFESVDRERLVSLRRTLLGAKSARRLEEAEKRESALESKSLSAMSADEQRAAGQQLGAMVRGWLENSPEIAEAKNVLEEMVRSIHQQGKKKKD